MPCSRRIAAVLRGGDRGHRARPVRRANDSRQAAPPPSGDRLTAEVLKGLEFRSIGPAISTGRVQDIAIDPKSPNTWYVATAFGGLWKTTNRGTTFTPIFDNGGSFTLCCVVVDPKNSNVVWLGTGENASQRSAHFGDGIYKSTDAGKTWQRMGLGDVRAHRQDPDRSAQLERRLRRGAGAAVVRRRRARPLQDDRRRHEVGRACSTSATTPASATSCSIRRTPTSSMPRPISGAAPSAR